MAYSGMDDVESVPWGCSLASIAAARDVETADRRTVNYLRARLPVDLGAMGGDDVGDVSIRHRWTDLPAAAPVQWEAVREEAQTVLASWDSRLCERISDGPMGSLLCVPMGAVGFLLVGAAKQGQFVAEDVTTVETAAAVLAGTVNRIAGESSQPPAPRDHTQFMLRVTNSMLWAIDLTSGKLVWTHGSTERLLGIESSTTLTIDEVFEEGVHPEDREELWEIFQAFVAGAIEMPTAEFRTHPDRGPVRWLSVTGYLRAHRSLAVGFVTDVTPQRRRRRRIERQRDRLGALAEAITHDLRTPLATAQLRLELAQEDPAEDHFEHMAAALEELDERTTELVAGVNADSEAIDPRAVSLEEIARRWWWPELESSATLDIEADRCILADPFALGELLFELFRNARQHGGEGVSLTVGPLTDGLGFYIADDGPGFPPAVHDELLDGRAMTFEMDVGAGLWTVREVCVAHDWTLTLTTSDGGGARVEVRGVESDHV